MFWYCFSYIFLKKSVFTDKYRPLLLTLCFRSYRDQDESENVVKAQKTKTLLVRHLPEDLSQDEKVDLLKYFGAESVRVHRGSMVCFSAITTFSDLEWAANMYSVYIVLFTET